MPIFSLSKISWREYPFRKYRDDIFERDILARCRYFRKGYSCLMVTIGIFSPRYFRKGYSCPMGDDIFKRDILVRWVRKANLRISTVWSVSMYKDFFKVIYCLMIFTSQYSIIHFQEFTPIYNHILWHCQYINFCAFINNLPCQCLLETDCSIMLSSSFFHASPINWKRNVMIRKMTWHARACRSWKR